MHWHIPEDSWSLLASTDSLGSTPGTPGPTPGNLATDWSPGGLKLFETERFQQYRDHLSALGILEKIAVGALGALGVPQLEPRIHSPRIHS